MIELSTLRNVSMVRKNFPLINQSARRRWGGRRVTGRLAGGADQTRHEAATRPSASELYFSINDLERVYWLISGEEFGQPCAV